jgi:ubiquinol-cytochrome c reductase iron-sulfur subunit
MKGDGSRAGNAVAILALFAWTALRSVARIFTGVPHALPDGLPEPAGETGRGADRIAHPERETTSHQRRGTLLVAAAFLIAVAGGVLFLISYWTEAANWWMGGMLAILLGGLGASMVLYSHWLTVEHQATEPREEIPSPPQERQRTNEQFCAGVHQMHRRGLLWCMGAAMVVFPGAIFVSLFRSLGRPPAPSLFNPIWKRGERLVSAEGKPVSISTLDEGSTIIVFPENRTGDERAQTVLIRVKQERLELPDGRNDWAPSGYVAYSRVCTHAGCAVGMFEATTGLLMCPCHQSTFDALRGARPNGGPAARPLPQLPLYADADGSLCAGGEFTEPPGPGFWSLG